jgi:hypothetical protein
MLNTLTLLNTILELASSTNLVLTRMQARAFPLLLKNLPSGTGQCVYLILANALTSTTFELIIILQLERCM